MYTGISYKFRQLLQAQNRRQVWYDVLVVLAAIVVFCTTYALLLPAVTMEGELECGLEEHTHGEECYGVDENGETVLICELEEHVHDEACYIVSKIPETVYLCGLSEHSHTEDCYKAGVLMCNLPEHSHSEGCLVSETALQIAAEAAEAAKREAINAEEVLKEMKVEVNGNTETAVDNEVVKDTEIAIENYEEFDEEESQEDEIKESLDNEIGISSDNEEVESDPSIFNGEPEKSELVKRIDESAVNLNVSEFLESKDDIDLDNSQDGEVINDRDTGDSVNSTKEINENLDTLDELSSLEHESQVERSILESTVEELSLDGQMDTSEIRAALNLPSVYASTPLVELTSLSSDYTYNFILGRMPFTNEEGDLDYKYRYTITNKDGELENTLDPSLMIGSGYEFRINLTRSGGIAKKQIYYYIIDCVEDEFQLYDSNGTLLENVDTDVLGYWTYTSANHNVGYKAVKSADTENHYILAFYPLATGSVTVSNFELGGNAVASGTASDKGIVKSIGDWDNEALAYTYNISLTVPKARDNYDTYYFVEDISSIYNKTYEENDNSYHYVTNYDGFNKNSNGIYITYFDTDLHENVIMKELNSVDNQDKFAYRIENSENNSDNQAIYIYNRDKYNNLTRGWCQEEDLQVTISYLDINAQNFYLDGLDYKLENQAIVYSSDGSSSASMDSVVLPKILNKTWNSDDHGEYPFKIEINSEHIDLSNAYSGEYLIIQDRVQGGRLKSEGSEYKIKVEFKDSPGDALHELSKSEYVVEPLTNGFDVKLMHPGNRMIVISYALDTARISGDTATNSAAIYNTKVSNNVGFSVNNSDLYGSDGSFEYWFSFIKTYDTDDKIPAANAARFGVYNMSGNLIAESYTINKDDFYKLYDDVEYQIDGEEVLQWVWGVDTSSLTTPVIRVLTMNDADKTPVMAYNYNDTSGGIDLTEDIIRIGNFIQDQLPQSTIHYVQEIQSAEGYNTANDRIYFYWLHDQGIMLPDLENLVDENNNIIPADSIIGLYGWTQVSEYFHYHYTETGIIINNEKGIELPQTGAIGSEIYILSGVFMLTLPLMYCVIIYTASLLKKIRCKEIRGVSRGEGVNKGKGGRMLN